MIKSKDKIFRKGIYLEIVPKKKKIEVNLYLNEHYCDDPIKKFEFNNKDTFQLNGLYMDILIQDYYENSSS